MGTLPEPPARKEAGARDAAPAVGRTHHGAARAVGADAPSSTAAERTRATRPGFSSEVSSR